MLYAFDRALSRAEGVALVGVDEAGRGPLAGPVVAAAVALDNKRSIRGINDSKKLSPRRREELFCLISRRALAFCAASSSRAFVDREGILKATFAACRKAVRGLEKKLGRRAARLIVFDGNLEIPRLGRNQKTLIGGDGKSACVAAASIVAKVTRDRIMRRLDAKYPEYGFAAHKGYGTRAHIAAIKKLGACPLHRKSFIKNIV
ncbi:MAG: ribonuclease HII [Elusimicrobia bacterium HGW-Elusimicrobia-1]|jgi:ribonuclease HII|nr:MAG: ribonuclease HII [Elusimicrobia bacterium HGW-Elusimicrobia-1]